MTPVARRSETSVKGRTRRNFFGLETIVTIHVQKKQPQLICGENSVNNCFIDTPRFRSIICSSRSVELRVLCTVPVLGSLLANTKSREVYKIHFGIQTFTTAKKSRVLILDLLLNPLQLFDVHAGRNGVVKTCSAFLLTIKSELHKVCTPIMVHA